MARFVSPYGAPVLEFRKRSGAGLGLRDTGGPLGPRERGGRLIAARASPPKTHGWHRVATSTPRGCPWKNYLSVAISALLLERYNYSGHVAPPTSYADAPVANRIARLSRWLHIRRISKFLNVDVMKNFSSFSFEVISVCTAVDV